MKRVAVIILSFGLYPAYAQMPRFIRAYGGSNVDVGRSIYHTSDGGYIVGGYTFSYGVGSADYILVKLSSTGNVQWARVYGGTGADTGVSVIQTSDGGYAIFGKTYSYGAGSADFLLVKVTSTGTISWAKVYGGAGADEGWRVIQHPSGGYVLVGSTGSWGPGISVARNFMVLRIDNSGDLVWGKAYGRSSSTNDEVAYSIKPTPDGGYIAVGFILWSFPDYDFLVLKIGSDGNLQWAKAYGGSGADTAFDVVVTSGGYLVLGTSNYGAGGRDIFLIKIDNSGNLLWAKTYGTSSNETSRSIYPTSDGNFVIVGWSGYGGNDNVLILKVDPSGNLIWARSYGGSGGDWGRSIQETSDGGLVIGGLTNSYGAGLDDILVIRTRGDGTIGGTCPVGNPPITVNTISSVPISNPTMDVVNVSTGTSISVSSSPISIPTFSVTDVCPLSSDGELSVPESQTLEGIISVGKGYIRLEGDAEISIYDQGGRLISFIKGSKGTTINLKPGTYFVVVEGRRLKGKVIVR